MPVPEATIEVTAGAVVSTVAVKGVDAAPWLPAASVARAVSETAPDSVPVVKVQAPPLSAVVLPRTVLPLRIWTMLPASAVPASARVVSSVVPPLVSAPVAEPALSVTVPMVGAAGAVWSMVVVKAAEAGPWLPAASVARAVSETEPDRAEVVRLHEPSPAAMVVPTAVAPS